MAAAAAGRGPPRQGGPMTAERIISAWMTQQSPASGSAWVSSATARADAAVAHRSFSRVRPTMPFLMRAPLPPVRLVAASRSAAAARMRAAMPGSSRLSTTASRTRRVWTPTSLAPSRATQRQKPRAISSRASRLVRSAPVAATRAMYRDICVSSLHSPGA